MLKRYFTKQIELKDKKYNFYLGKRFGWPILWGKAALFFLARSQGSYSLNGAGPLKLRLQSTLLNSTVSFSKLILDFIEYLLCFRFKGLELISRQHSRFLLSISHLTLETRLKYYYEDEKVSFFITQKLFQSDN